MKKGERDLVMCLWRRDVYTILNVILRVDVGTWLSGLDFDAASSWDLFEWEERRKRCMSGGISDVLSEVGNFDEQTQSLFDGWRIGVLSVWFDVWFGKKLEIWRMWCDVMWYDTRCLLKLGRKIRLGVGDAKGRARCWWMRLCALGSADVFVKRRRRVHCIRLYLPLISYLGRRLR